MRNKTTPQRAKIFQFLCSTKTHPSAEEIYGAIKEELPGISPATVYRNLQNMVSEGKILKFYVEKEYRYDANNVNHAHFICKSCRIILDLPLKEEINGNYFGRRELEIDNIQFICYGICGNCKR